MHFFLLAVKLNFICVNSG